MMFESLVISITISIKVTENSSDAEIGVKKVVKSGKRSQNEIKFDKWVLFLNNSVNSKFLKNYDSLLQRFGGGFSK